MDNPINIKLDYLITGRSTSMSHSVINNYFQTETDQNKSQNVGH